MHIDTVADRRTARCALHHCATAPRSALVLVACGARSTSWFVLSHATAFPSPDSTHYAEVARS